MDKSVTVETSLALTMLKSGNVTQLILPSNRFELPVSIALALQLPQSCISIGHLLGN
jgi:hypothetical protein